MKDRYTSLLVLMIFLFPSGELPAQDAEALAIKNPVLQNYINEALQSNQGLKQVQLDYAVQLAAMKEARGLFFPDLSLNARYTVADGGRVIEFPVGDLLNPVYSTLNMLTGSEQFPQLENEEIPFLRPREHETKLSLVQPVFSPDIRNNYKIREQGSELARIGIERYRQELVREISRAYYEHQKSLQLVSLADTSLALVKENLRVSRALAANDKVTIDVVYRSEAEVGKVEVQQAQARNMQEASRAYFNFLLNRELEAEILSFEEEPQVPLLSLEDASAMALANREELRQLEAYARLVERQTALYRGSNIPGLFGVVDYGFQGEDYSFTAEDDYVMASLVLQWNLFQGRVNHHKVQQSRIEGDKVEVRMEETRQQIRVEVINHYYALQAAHESVLSSRSQLQSANRAYELIRRKYQEGQSSLLELIDARTNLTSAAANVIIARSEYFSNQADLRYATGLKQATNQ